MDGLEEKSVERLQQSIEAHEPDEFSFPRKSLINPSACSFFCVAALMPSTVSGRNTLPSSLVTGTSTVSSNPSAREMGADAVSGITGAADLADRIEEMRRELPHQDLIGRYSPPHSPYKIHNWSDHTSSLPLHTARALRSTAEETAASFHWNFSCRQTPRPRRSKNGWRRQRYLI